MYHYVIQRAPVADILSYEWLIYSTETGRLLAKGSAYTKWGARRKVNKRIKRAKRRQKDKIIEERVL